MSREAEDIEFWHPRLEQGERILWVGRPRWTFVPNRAALTLTVPVIIAALGVLWGGMDLLEALFATAPDSGAVELRLKLGAIAVILWCLVYLYALCVVSPSFHRYALTDRRALVRSSLPWPRTLSWRLTPGSAIDWDGRHDGSILFDDHAPDSGARGDTASAAGTLRDGFRSIRDAGMVHELMRDVAQGLPAGR